MGVSLSIERSYHDRNVGGYEEGGRLTSLDISIVDCEILQVYYQSPGLIMSRS